MNQRNQCDHFWLGRQFEETLLNKPSEVGGGGGGGMEYSFEYTPLPPQEIIPHFEPKKQNMNLGSLLGMNHLFYLFSQYYIQFDPKKNKGITIFFTKLHFFGTIKKNLLQLLYSNKSAGPWKSRDAEIEKSERIVSTCTNCMQWTLQNPFASKYWTLQHSFASNIENIEPCIKILNLEKFFCIKILNVGISFCVKILNLASKYWTLQNPFASKYWTLQNPFAS